MMEDNKVAKAFLSAIIQEEVTELDFASQEHTARIPSKKKRKRKEETESSGITFTVCRFDFSARIATPGGRYRTVLIELQKAKLVSDIMRFRRYLGIHYRNPANTYGKGDHRKARQIYCIFLLGYDIGVSGRPVIQVDSQTKDVATNEEVEIRSNEFIESLHHRSWIVQIDQLKQRRRNDLEKLLSIFDQTNRTINHHIMNVNEEDFPEMYRPIIRRLRMAAESEDIQIEMEMEDDYLQELQDKERKIAQKEKELAQARKIPREQKKTLKDKDKALEDKDKALKDKDKALKDKDKALEDNKKALEDKDRLIEELKKQLTARSH
jgi:tetratricopeptide (TPR) repeat protein